MNQVIYLSLFLIGCIFLSILWLLIKAMITMKKKIRAQTRLIAQSNADTTQLLTEIAHYKEMLAMTEPEMTFPIFKYDSPQSYRRALAKIYAEQKAIDKVEETNNDNSYETVQDHHTQERKENDQAAQLAILAFNQQVDRIIQNVNRDNYDVSISQLEQSFDQINTLNEPNNLRITSGYFLLKIDELILTYESRLRQSLNLL